MSIWGAIQSSDSFFRGCRSVSTASHGGIILTENALKKSGLFDKILAADLAQFDGNNGHYYFEEDVDANIVLALLPRDLLAKHYKSCLTEEGYQKFKSNCYKSLKLYNPNFFEAITGTELTPFDSKEKMAESLKGRELWFYSSATSGYNVPAGFVAVTFEQSSEGFVKHKKNTLKRCQLTSREEYHLIRDRAARGIPVDIDIREREFTVDYDMPSSRPAQINPLQCYLTKTIEKDQILYMQTYCYGVSKIVWLKVDDKVFRMLRDTQRADICFINDHYSDLRQPVIEDGFNQVTYKIIDQEIFKNVRGGSLLN